MTETATPPRVDAGTTPPPAASACENCGTALAGPYCAACGQRAVSPLRSLRAAVADAASAAFSFDTRLARAGRLLVARPGALTTAYVTGHRAPYPSPATVYVAASVVYFAVSAARGESSVLGFLTFGEDVSPSVMAWAPQLQLFVLVPVFAGLVAVLYRRRFYVAHLAFSLHFFALFLLSASAVSLWILVLGAAGVDTSGNAPWWARAVGIWLQLAAPLSYLGLALHRVYGGSRWSAAWKCAVLLALWFASIAAFAGAVDALFG